MNQRFIVPQFIDAEDKIFGPITVRQFLIMVGGFLFIFIFYKTSDFGLFIFQTAIVVIATLTFAFVKINGAPFHLFFINFVSTFKKPKIRSWRKEQIKVAEFKSKDEDKAVTYVKKKRILPTSKLSELSLIIDTGGVYKGKQAANQVNKVYNNS